MKDILDFLKWLLEGSFGNFLCFLLLYAMACGTLIVVSAVIGGDKK